MPDSSGQSVAKSASLAITDHGSASFKAVDRKPTSPTPQTSLLRPITSLPARPTKEEALKMLEEEMKDDSMLHGYARKQLSGLVDLYKSLLPHQGGWRHLPWI